MTLRNRIVGYGEVDPADLLANPRNHRIHPKAQQDALAGSLEEVGWVRDILVNRASGFVIDGHARVVLALRRGERSVPVSYVDLTPKEEALVLASLDYITGMAAIDNEQLDALLREVSTGNAALQAMLSDMAKGAGLFDLDGLGEDDGPVMGPDQFGVTVLCDDEAEQQECFRRLSQSGYTCRLMVA